MDLLVFALTILAGIVVYGALPPLLVWALNVLFGLGLALTWKTWGAALVLILIFGAKAKS